MVLVENKRPDQIDYFTSDQEQYRPYQIVDLLLKIGHSLRSLLRLRCEDGSQKKNDGYRSQDYPYQLVHNARSSLPRRARQMVASPHSNSTANFDMVSPAA